MNRTYVTLIADVQTYSKNSLPFVQYWLTLVAVGDTLSQLIIILRSFSINTLMIYIATCCFSSRNDVLMHTERADRLLMRVRSISRIEDKGDFEDRGWSKRKVHSYLLLARLEVRIWYSQSNFWPVQCIRYHLISVTFNESSSSRVHVRRGISSGNKRESYEISFVYFSMINYTAR